MRAVRLLLLVAVAFPCFAAAQKPPPLKAGFWAPLLRPGQRWVLKSTSSSERSEIVVETYDVRAVAGATVARLRWTHVVDGKTYPVAQGAPTQIAMNRRGVWWLAAGADDDEVAAALVKSPRFADPPELWKMGRKDGQAVLREERNGRFVTCLGEWPRPGDGPCDDTCYANMCIGDGDAGIVEVEGTWAPNYMPFIAAGWEASGAGPVR